MKKSLIISAFTIISFIGLAQKQGCTDSHAYNYKATATLNDGSCLYDPLILQPEVLIESLPSKVDETSGLIWFADSFWTHNDSGGEPAIYRLDKQTGELLETVTIVNGENVDIEDITQDDTYIYIADFGNNYGTRQDLTIYKIKKSAIDLSLPETAVEAEKIFISYNDQDSFERKNRKNNFDAEALLSFGDHLYLFTKNWVDEQTKCYKISKKPGTYPLEVYSTFNVRGLITGADYKATDNSIILVGYENFVPFVWVLWDFKNDEFFSGNKRRADFAFIQGAQTEGICFTENDRVLMSCEASFFPPRLYSFESKQITNAPHGTEAFKPFKINTSQDTIQQRVYIDIEGLENPEFEIELYNLGWEKVRQYSFRENNFENNVNVSISDEHLNKGLYFVRVKQGDKIGFKKLFLE